MEKEDFNYDDLKNIISTVNENKDLINAVLKLLEKLKGAGAVEIISYITDIFPDNTGLFAGSFTFDNFTGSLSKSGNTTMSLLFLLSNDEMSDIIKAISFNSQGIAEAMIDNVSSAQPMPVFKLISIFRNPEVAAGLNAFMGALKVPGNSLKKLK